MSIREKDLKKLSRTDLLELLLEQSEQNDLLRKENAELSQKLADKKIILESCGSIAAASLQLSGIFAAAQQAADVYLDNVREYSESREQIFARIVAEANEVSDRMIADTKRKCLQMEEESKKESEKIIRCAKKAADDYWNAKSQKYNIKEGVNNG